MEKILVAMSGGVDSSVAALLLKEQGYPIVGAYMKNWINEDNIFGDCPWQQDIEDARRVAENLGIEFRVVNLMDDYKSRIVEYLLDGYKRGITPNPDVMCNREIKFGVFAAYARDQGFDAVATGHYARRIDNDKGLASIYEGVDKNKDQSYFLALLQQEQIQYARFPIGHLTKPQLREIAQRHQLHNAGKKDSQGICFIGNIRMQDFLRAYLQDKPGPIVTPAGKEIGQHRGLHYYTIGQRKGIGIPSNTDFKNYVVIGKDIAANSLLVAFDGMDAPGLYSQERHIHSLSFTEEPLRQTQKILARPRYRDPAQAIEFIPAEGNTARVIFEKPQRAIASGQIIAFYDGERLVGGGIFS